MPTTSNRFEQRKDKRSGERERHIGETRARRTVELRQPKALLACKQRPKEHIVEKIGAAEIKLV